MTYMDLVSMGQHALGQVEVVLKYMYIVINIYQQLHVMYICTSL